MAVREVDLRGLACPEPVIRLRKILIEAGGGTVRAQVSDQVSVENIQRLAAGLGWSVAAEPEGDCYRLTLTAAQPGDSARKRLPCHPRRLRRQHERRLVVLIAAEHLGSGDEQLGRILMRAFLKTLAELQPPPGTVIFLNSGVRLTTQGSEVLDDIRRLESLGVEILSCGTCLDFYHLKDALAVGRGSNMFEIVSALAAAGQVLRP